MSVVLQQSALSLQIQQLVESHGFSHTSVSGHTITGEHTAILAKWFLGGRKVTCRFSVRFDDATNQAWFREVVTESSWGIPPPSLTVQKTSQHGSRMSESRTDRGIGGGGTLERGRLREALGQVVQGAGWQLTFEPGRMP
jgi:hypothetical protein